MLSSVSKTIQRGRIPVALVLGVLPALAVEPGEFQKTILPIMQDYCINCHNADTLKGDLDIERFESAEMVTDSIALWRRMVMRIQNNEMPPKGKPRPTEEEKRIIADWVSALKAESEDCDRLATEENVSWYPGYVMSRRLNRAEYENTVKDLLGIDLPLADLFPADGAGGEGFDNNGNALFLSAIQLEKCVEAADLAVETALPHKTFARKRPRETPLVIAAPGRGVSPQEAARVTLRHFLERAWRRPVEAGEVDGVLELFHRAYKRGDGYEESLKLAFKAALVSPNFLFLAEPEPAQPGVYELGDFPLASRLSYFLWASMPDEDLLELARQGRLRDPGELERQTRRMIRHPKARALGRLFATQWLGIAQLGETVRPDSQRFPEFDDALRDAMREETVAFFNRIVEEDRSLLELLDADYTFANERLAAIYGIAGVTGADVRLVALEDRNRGGVLGMASVLTATSHPLRTSPVLRGKWVLEQLLGDRVPPPPPDAGQLPEDDVQADGLSLRARLEAHRANPECASCHARMDPIGFGLEHFDPIGRWRTEQAGFAIDSKGELPSGETFTSPAELKTVLLKRKDDFIRNLSRKMLGYALGRSLTSYDNCVIDDCVEALRRNDYRASSLFTEIVLSYPFRHRYSGRSS